MDTTPPRLAAQVRITETDDAWRVKFSTVGQEVIGLPTVTGPHLLCAIPNDAAQNAGPRWQRLLRWPRLGAAVACPSGPAAASPPWSAN